MSQPRPRVHFFVDGSNWYHSLRAIGLSDLGRLHYPRVFEKLTGPGRDWIAARYYIPDVGIIGSPALLREQRKFLDGIRAQDQRIRVSLGRLEARTSKNDVAVELLRYLTSLDVRIESRVYGELFALGRAHQRVKVFVEKAIDVQIAVDMVQLSVAGAFDDAFLLSADGDYTPAVAAVRGYGRRVYSATPAPCVKLAAAVDQHFPLRRDWFEDCFHSEK